MENDHPERRSDQNRLMIAGKKMKILTIMPLVSTVSIIVHISSLICPLDIGSDKLLIPHLSGKYWIIAYPPVLEFLEAPILQIFPIGYVVLCGLQQHPSRFPVFLYPIIKITQPWLLRLTILPF